MVQTHSIKTKKKNNENITLRTTKNLGKVNRSKLMLTKSKP